MAVDKTVLSYQRALGVAIAALQFYADEAPYHAMAFMADRPAGGFADDFNKEKGSQYNRPMPGKTARKAIRTLHNRFGDLTIRG